MECVIHQVIAWGLYFSVSFLTLQFVEIKWSKFVFFSACFETAFLGKRLAFI